MPDNLAASAFPCASFLPGPAAEEARAYPRSPDHVRIRVHQQPRHSAPGPGTREVLNRSGTRDEIPEQITPMHPHSHPDHS